MAELQGIDVSHYNGVIDWGKVARSGRKFAILKCQYEAQSHRIDETFEYNYENAKKSGLSVGVYIFIASASISNPKLDAECLLAHLRGRFLEYGIWLDLESDVLKSKGRAYIRDLVYTYAQIFRSAGYYVGIYCNRDWYLNVIHNDLKSRFDFWIARYKKNDDGVYYKFSSLKPPANMAVAWQYSSKGRVPGIKGDVDLDVDYDGIVSLIAETPHRKTNDEIVMEVLAGKWGTKDTRPTRKEMLTRAGYDYETIRKMVNAAYEKQSPQKTV